MDPKLLATPVLKTRGWTDSLIRKFLGAPDESRLNPKYPNAGSRMKLYRRDRVEGIEASAEFQDAKRKADARKESAKRGVGTKMEKMQDYLESLTIDVPQMDKEALIAAAKKNLHSLDLPDCVELSTERICVNFLRHCETKYERELEKIAGKTGARDAYYEIKGQVLFEIALAYPWLSDECERQRKAMSEKQMNDF